MVKVSIHSDIEHKKVAEEYVRFFKIWKEDNILSDYFGADGQWEDNHQLCSSQVFKMHIKMPTEVKWTKKTRQSSRKSDNYLVYCRHWSDRNRYQILAIMSPNAHQQAKTSYLAELERRAEEFQNSF